MTTKNSTTPTRILGVISLLTGLVLGTTAITASADGTETLGPPSIEIAEGTDLSAGGVGLELGGPGTIAIDVPAGNTVAQVLVYWEGQHSSATVGADDTITIDGVSVTGTLIGGPTYFFSTKAGEHWSSTYRADITALGLVSPGSNSLTVDGLAFDQVSNGAGILVISSDGGVVDDIALVDGNDLAYFDFSPPLDTTVPQTFTFEPAPVDRTLDLIAFASSVAGPDLPQLRPNVIEVVVGGVATRFINPLASNDGGEWDTVILSVEVPAGADSLTIQALSTDDEATGERPASFAWLAAGIALPPYVPPTTTTTTTTTEPTTTTTTTTEPTTTTSTTTSTTTTTEPATTTSTTTTTEPATTTTEPATTTSTTTTTLVGSGAVTTTVATELPATGGDGNRFLVVLGGLMIALGGALILTSRRTETL